MSLRFILGRAGTGKTHLCLEEMARRVDREGEWGEPLILLVPEQATFQTERALLERIHAPATARLHVLSFRRLAHRILQETGGAARSTVGELGKKLALRAVLDRQLGALSVLRRSAAKSGFVDHLARLIRELRAHRIEAEVLEQRASDPKLPEALRAKLADLATILKHYEDWLQQNRHLDPDRRLELVAHGLQKKTFLSGASIWIDGFSGFTPAETRVLSGILAVCRQCSIALCLDGRRPLGLPPAETDLFRQTRETYLRLTELAGRIPVPIVETKVLDGDKPPRRFSRNPPLARIESEFFPDPALQARRHPVSGGSSVQLIEASDPSREAEAVAAEIVRLCRDQGMRPRDISVVLRTLEPYEDWLRRWFSAYGIPYFLDRKRSLAHHPLVELIVSALEVVERDWEPHALFRYLKTDLVPLSREAVDRLEEYVHAHGIRGRSLFLGPPWAYVLRDDPEEDPEIAIRRVHEELSSRNADRDQAAGALRRLDRIWFPDGKTDRPHRPTGRQIAEAIARLLEDLGVPDRLREWRQDAWKAGRITEAREHEQAWQAVAGFLTEFAAVFRDEHMGPEEAGRILRGGLEQLRLGLIPPSLDQVLVGTVDRSRQPDVRVTFLMGANEGVFPGHPPEDPIFPDEDRQTLHAVGLELSADSRMRLFHERYLTYIALTRPRERLYVTFSHSDGMGRERKPSPIVLRLRRMFPDVKVISYPAAQQETPRQIEHPEILAARLPAVFREFRDGMLSPHLANGGVTAGLLAEWVGAYRWLAEHPEWRESLLRRIPALAEPRPVPALPPDLVNALYGTPMRTSVSRLESQAACPFQHFARYGLGLKASDPPELDPLRQGSLLHGALRRITVAVAGGEEDWAELQPETLDQLADAALSELGEWFLQGMALDSARRRYLLRNLRSRLRWILELCVLHARRGIFRPLAAEWTFGGSGREPVGQAGLDALPALRVSEEGPGDDSRILEIRGRIDRVDTADIDGELWVRVIDYKSSGRRFQPGDLVHGISLQLAAYLAVVLEHGVSRLRRKIRPAGAFFFPMELPTVKEPPSEKALERERVRKSRLTGIMVDDPKIVRAMDRDIHGWSDLIPVGLSSRTGEIHRSSSVANEDDLRALADFARRKMADLGREIRSGRIAPRPYRTPSGHTPCGTCPFQGVCRFEGVYGRYRDLPRLSSDEAWRHIRGQRGESS